MSNVQMPGTQGRKSDQQAAAGMQIGSAIPGPHQIPMLVASVAMGQKKGPQQIQAVDSGAASNAMQRRMASIQEPQNNVMALREAESSLASLPPAQAQQYAPTIKKARYLAESEIA